MPEIDAVEGKSERVAGTPRCATLRIILRVLDVVPAG